MGVLAIVESLQPDVAKASEVSSKNSLAKADTFCGDSTPNPQQRETYVNLSVLFFCCGNL